MSLSPAPGELCTIEEVEAAWDGGFGTSGLMGAPVYSFFVSSFYFPIPEKKEPCFRGEAERKASKIFGK